MTIPAQRVPDDVDSWTLVARAQAGDGEAFGVIYDRYFDSVFTYVFQRTRSRQIAEDITSATWERALRRIGSVTYQGRDFGAWLTTIARNVVNDYYKSAAVRLSTAYGPGLEEILEEDSDPALEAERSDAAAILAAALAHLTEHQRRTLRLRYWAGLTIDETAAELGRDGGAIKALTYRALRSLSRNPAVAALRATS